ncbi:MAG: helicase [bacterium]|nr:helicase [bacterium]
MNYLEFIAGKLSHSQAEPIPHNGICKVMFPWQAELVAKALDAGRYALFTDTGTGKTMMQLEWARHVSRIGRVLILAPLAVAEQTSMAARDVMGMDVPYRREDDGSQIIVTNYEMLGHFEASFAGVVLDESSILKAYDGKTRTQIIERFGTTQHRLACTATPAPNDHMELGNHSEFLGHKSRSEMLSEYFVHDGSTTQQWRIKGHASEIFWKWICSWAAIMSRPSDIGYDDEGYVLPPLVFHEHQIPIDHVAARDAGFLFAMDARTLSEQRAIRRGTLKQRVSLATGIVTDTTDPVIVWCEMNAEGDALTRAIPGAVQIKGSDSYSVKHDRLTAFGRGDIRVLVTKPSIAGFGLNWQHCSTVVFVGASHSFEQTYQAIRRCWRFGQDKQVDVHIVRAETETAIVENYQRKEREFAKLRSEMMRFASKAQAQRRWIEYNPDRVMEIPQWIV